ncbi:hypothetical protein AURDEDRAFT_113819 [Auricularia subglabra TFB-10046 SS5]|nr:hypothetical protein AURDEDRAFT_113819 [Auricularia subglabra TFB-10046 SS5]
MSAVARVARRWVHASASSRAASKFVMPAMSPTMTEGGIASWKKREGESFSAGEVLLEIETDKATIDVEAQDDGVLAKILAPDGTKNVQVGKMIAVLAEPGDDLASLEIPKDDAPAPPPPAPKQESKPAPSPARGQTTPPPAKRDASPGSVPLFPSVQRLLHEHGVSGEGIKGTGIRGMLTKGDVLAHLGLASSPTGTFKQAPRELPKPGAGGAQAPQPEKVYDGASIRRLIVESLAQAAKPPAPSPTAEASFASILADYARAPSPAAKAVITDVLPTPPPPVPASKLKPAGGDFLDGLV